MIEIYTKDYCPYCWQAKTLLESKSVEWVEFDVTRDRALETEMRERSGGRTVPQIFIGEQAVGGAAELFELEAAGKLDSLLAPFLTLRNTEQGGSHYASL